MAATTFALGLAPAPDAGVGDTDVDKQVDETDDDDGGPFVLARLVDEEFVLIEKPLFG